VCTYTPSKRRARAAATEATAGSLLRTATVYYDHPVHTPALHTLNIDFANPAEGAPARLPRHPCAPWSTRAAR